MTPQRRDGIIRAINLRLGNLPAVSHDNISLYEVVDHLIVRERALEQLVGTLTAAITALLEDIQ